MLIRRNQFNPTTQHDGEVKILCITKDRSKQMEKSSYYLMEELKKQCRLVMWTENGHIERILSQLPFIPDFILMNDFLDPRLCPSIYGLNSINIPKGMIYHDISYELEHRKRYAKKEKIDYIFTHYRDAFLKWYPELKESMIWLPHHVNIEVYKDYQLPKSIDSLMMGAMLPHIYPLRVMMLNTLKDTPGFVYHGHPGYTEVQDIAKGTLVGEDYAKEINRAKVFLTCNSVYEYTLMKYFEVMACKTLLIAPESEETKDLGMIDGVHYCAVNRTNFLEKANYYLTHDAEREMVTNNGHQLAVNYHSTCMRAQQLLETIKNIVEKKKQS